MGTQLEQQLIAWLDSLAQGNIAMQLVKQFIAWLNNLAQSDIVITLAVIGIVAALSGLLVAAILRLLRALLPFLVVTGAVVLCWHTGLLGQCYQWFTSLGQ